MLVNVLLSALIFMSSPATKQVNRNAQNFHLRTLEGKLVSLKQYRGNVVLVNFWATWCNGAQTELPRLAQMQQKYASRGLKVLAVNVDNDRAQVVRFLKRHGIRVETLWDGKRRAARRFYVENMPSSYLIDRTGRVRFVHRGYLEANLDQIENEVETLLGEPAQPQKQPTQTIPTQVSSLGE